MISKIDLKKINKSKIFLLCASFLFLILGSICLAGCNEPIYKISVGEYTGGVISVSKTEAKAWQTIAVVCMPNAGYALKEGSLIANENIVQNFTFVLPEEDVTVYAKFLPLNYGGTYIANAKESYNTAAQDFSFIKVQENGNLVIGSESDDHSYTIEQNVTYTFDNFELTVPDEADKIFIEDGQLIFKDKIYNFSPEPDEEFLNSTLIHVYGLLENDARNDFDLDNSVYTVETDITFTNGEIIRSRITSDNQIIQSSCNCWFFGHLVYVETDNEVYYGLFNTLNETVGLEYVCFMPDNGAYSYGKDLFIIKSDNEIGLKQNGSYIGKNGYNIEGKENEIVSFDGEKLNVALTSVTIQTSVPGVSSVEYYQIENPPMKRAGNLLIVSLTGKYEDVVFLYIVNEDLILKLGAFMKCGSATYLYFQN